MTLRKGFKRLKSGARIIHDTNRVFVRTPSGRKRFNVLAALNAVTHEVITVTNDTIFLV